MWFNQHLLIMDVDMSNPKCVFVPLCCIVWAASRPPALRLVPNGLSARHLHLQPRQGSLTVRISRFVIRDTSSPFRLALSLYNKAPKPARRTSDDKPCYCTAVWVFRPLMRCPCETMYRSGSALSLVVVALAAFYTAWNRHGCWDSRYSCC